MLRAIDLLNPQHHNPRIVADCADFLRDEGDAAAADALYADLRKWHPRAVERDRAFLARAEIAFAGGRSADALAFLERLLKETGFSPRVSDAQILKARLLVDQGDAGEGLDVLGKLLEDQAVPSKAKAAALFWSGEILAGQGEVLRATAFFERVYLTYGKYGRLVAQSYLRRAELLEGLGKREEAVEVYRELAGRADMKEHKEFRAARDRLKELEQDA